MKLVVKKTDSLSGIIKIPGSKSHSIRALLFATLAEMQTGERSTFTGLLESDDTAAARSACAALIASERKINTGNSGITTRFIMPMLGLRKNAEQPIILEVDAQMRARPMESLIDALRTLGMQIESVNGDGSLPVRVSGKLRGGKVEVSGQTSQYVSALLMSLPAADGDSIVTVRNLKERPYTEIMLSCLDFYGIRYEHKRNRDEDGNEVEHFHIPGGQTYVAKDRNIPGDFSSASYPLAAAAILPGELRLLHLDPNDIQGDKAVIEVLQKMGADISWQKSAEGNELLIRGARPLKGIEIDCNLFPDMLPTLAFIATQAEGETRLLNVAHARIKETDRLHSMRVGLQKMGADVEELGDGLVIRKSNLHGARVHGYEDHRTTMALALAAMMADGETVIDTAEGISKTFPDFVQLMKNLGADMQTQQDHMVVIGFKHSGKTTLGEGLAEVFDRDFIDLDDKIEKLHGGSQKCREIMREHGAEYFRKLETKALKLALQAKPSVISLGGGAPMRPENQAMLRGELCVHLRAEMDELIARIEINGWPAFADEENPQEFLRKIWLERAPVYEKLATVTVQSQQQKHDTLEQAKIALAQHMPVNFVIGTPLDHTFTPRLHNSVYQKLGVNFSMAKHSCLGVEDFLKKIHLAQVPLTVVTMPHKQAIMKHLDEVSQEAQEIGAVNTVINHTHAGGHLTGYNTDIDGIAYALRNEKIADQKVLLLGAGGAAKAAAYFINREGGNLYCLNRNRQKAETLTAQFGGQALDRAEIVQHEFTVIINATPLGMGEHIGISPLKEDEIRGTETVFDMIYNPAETQLLKIAREAACKTVPGLDMFVAQGLKQIELLTGKTLDPKLFIKKLS